MIGIIGGHLAVLNDAPPVLLRIGPAAVRWYALAYLGGLFGGWWVLARMLRRSCAPLSRVQLEEFVFWAAFGVILGGRLGYVLAYNLDDYLRQPLEIFAVWHGGMSFHGGALGLLAATVLFCRSKQLSWLRVFDYVVVVQPIGQGLGRLANFFNAELWGAPTTLPWGVIFRAGDPPRHPSQLYEFALEGVALLAGLSWLFWRTDARRRPGLLMGAYALGFGVFRIAVEFIREPDEQLAGRTGPLHMGQWLSLPMIALGVFLIVRALRRPLVQDGALEAVREPAEGHVAAAG
jgi:phosphatidylglycerol:prolipoprotein diacylglycerol transferase